MYVITGATGNTGKRISHALLDAGKQVRVIGRSAERMQEFADKGADVFVGDLNDRAAMEKAFNGATAAYVMVPPKYDAEDFRAYQNEVNESLANALEKSQVKHVVALSSVGAELPSGNGPVAGLYDMEQRLNKLDEVHILYLRPGYFMENTMMQIGTIKAMGFAGTPVKPDATFGMIATQDIAAYAVKRLLALDFTGHSHQELQGNRDLSYAEVTKLYGEKIGKPDLEYVQVTPEQALQGMMQVGMSQSAAEMMLELSEGLNTGEVHPLEPRNDENTTPTTIEQFAEYWTAAYNAS
ncbi:NmrA family NAD(P)-binding protein [bacterium]|nr:NmrA family NAD(P)-binding protein [bacterium]